MMGYFSFDSDWLGVAMWLNSGHLSEHAAMLTYAYNLDTKEMEAGEKFQAS